MMKTLIMTLLLTLSPSLIASPFAKPSEAHGVLNLQQSHPSKNIFAVKVYEIDGKNIITRDSGMWLKPGKHTLKMSAVIPLDQLSYSAARVINSNSIPTQSLEVNVEEGKMYYIGYDASERNPRLWKPTIWKVKEL